MMCRQFGHAVVALALLAACGAPVDAPVGPPNAQAPRLERSSSAPVHQVTGGGKLDVSQFGLAPETYAFTASQDADGTVRGQMQVRFSDPLVEIHADVTCLSVDGTSAWIGLVVTRSDDESLMPLGAERWVRVQDNGEGPNDPPDRMDFFRPGGGAARCNERRPVAMPFVWLDGNIRVR